MRIALSRLALPAVLGLLSSLPVAAQTGQGSVVCAASTSNGLVTTCDGHLAVTVHSDGPGILYGLELTAPASHCSPVHYLAQSQASTQLHGLLGRTDALQAGQSGWVPLGDSLARGNHTFYVSAMGLVTGCNTGVMHSWGVSWRAIIVPR